MRNAALATAGFSAAIIILLSQLHGTPSYSAVSLWSSIFSMVLWLFAFLYVTAYLLHGERVYKHINIFVVAGVAMLGYLALFVAVVATVWQLSDCAGVTLTILGVVLAIAAFIHFQAVERLCNESDA